MFTHHHARRWLVMCACTLMACSLNGRGAVEAPYRADAGERGAPPPSPHGTSFSWLARLFDFTPREPYPLDDTPRYIASGQPLPCADTLTVYRGDAVRYQSAVRVHPAFTARLARLDKLIEETAREVYGRAPERLLHAGTYNCRTVRGRERRLSEHALGNAIDLRGFSFGPHRRKAHGELDEALPRRLRYRFQVTVGKHWNAADEVGAVHGKFLHTLARRLESERVFRGMIGPSHRGHQSHLHLDMGPYRYVWL